MRHAWEQGRERPQGRERTLGQSCLLLSLSCVTRKKTARKNGRANSWLRSTRVSLPGFHAAIFSRFSFASRTARQARQTRDLTNHNATRPVTSPEVICSQSASLRMLGTELQRVSQRVFFTFRVRGLNLQRFQKT